MEPIVQSDIFFFITSISVGVFTLFLIIAGFHMVKILRNFSQISETLKNRVNAVDADLGDISEHIRESAVFSFLFGKKRKTTHKK